MKNIFTTLILSLIAVTSFTQNFQPFSSSTSKRFFAIGNPADNDYFFHSVDSISSGDTIILSNYYAIYNSGNTSNFGDCPAWGGGTGEELDTTWLGTNIRMNTVSGELLLKNSNDELLNFDFSIPIMGTSLFYSDASRNYYIEHTSTTSETFYGVTDNVHIFEIQAFDLGGSPVSSPLNGFEIRLSENNGLLSFINCFDFPSVQQGYELQGQTNPLIGSYQLTYSEAYPWQAGDVLQYYTYSSPQQPYTKYAYQTWNVTDRTETVDSVFITFTSVLQELAYTGPPIAAYALNSNPIRYKKNTPIWESPWNMAQTDGGPNYFAIQGAEEELVIPGCSTNSQFVTLENFSSYCDSCHCFIQLDGFGSAIKNHFYGENIGIYKKTAMSYGSSSPGQSAQLVYWNVNGEECGTLYNSTEELIHIQLSVSPNPTRDILKISSDHKIESIRLSDLSGRLIFSQKKIALHLTEISLASLQKGAYILEVGISGTIQKRTVIRE